MPRWYRLRLTMIAAVLLAGLSRYCAADTPAASLAGYLGSAEVPDATSIIGPPPAAGTGTKVGDDRTYRLTRRLEGSARWQLAQRDADYSLTAVLSDFSCAAGRLLAPAGSPVLGTLVGRALADAVTAARNAKQIYRRPRPFVEHGGAICIAKDPSLTASYSYPSGHSTTGWMSGLVLAAVFPANAEAILARARAYGDSRVVCGVHYESDVAAGRLVAAAVFARLEATTEFRADLERAREEAKGAPAANPDAARCALDAAALRTPVW